MQKEPAVNAVILLGSENCDRGHLSHMAKARARLALEQYEVFENVLIFPTGGKGPGFNTSHRLHAEILADFLIEHGVNPQHIIQLSNSSNTVEDLMAARERLFEIRDSRGIRSVSVITSDYHAERVGRILDTHFFKGLNISVLEAVTDIDRIGLGKFRQLVQHEQAAVSLLVEKQGGLAWQGEIHPFLSSGRNLDVTSFVDERPLSLNPKCDLQPPLQP